jgi:hypothetical protein
LVQKITELDIQIALWKDLQSSRDLVMPNYTPKKWFECDVMAVTKAGYFEEYEIKLSASDFKADAKKCAVDGYCRGKRIEGKNKHLELQNKSLDGPARFWFVVSHTIVDKIEIPEWAGLKVAYNFNQNGRVYLKDHKKAPKLHSSKVDGAIIEHAKSVCYWRFWNIKCDMDKCVKRELRRIENL